MALIREEGEIQLECDKKGCKKCTAPYTSDSFHQMISHAKSDGWQIFKQGDKFVHFCEWLHAAPER